jgi:hypothetical protein
VLQNARVSHELQPVVNEQRRALAATAARWHEPHPGCPKLLPPPAPPAEAGWPPCPTIPGLNAVQSMAFFASEAATLPVLQDADKEILRALKEAGRLVDNGAIMHSYPFCWRSDTPLIYRAVPSWFVRVEEIKPQVGRGRRQGSCRLCDTRCPGCALCCGGLRACLLQPSAAASGARRCRAGFCSRQPVL